MRNSVKALLARKQVDPTLITSARNMADSLLAYWKLDESSGDAVDSAGSFDLADTFGNVAVGVGWVYSQAAVFSGTAEQELAVGDNAALEMGSYTDWWMAAWIYPTTIVGANRIVIDKAASYSLEVFADTSRVKATITTAGPTPRELTDANFGAISLDTWYLVVFVNDGTQNQRRLYVNNVLTTGATAYTAQNTANSLRVGRTSNGSTWVGRIGPAMIGVDYAPTNDDVAWLYNSGYGRLPL